MSVELGQLRTKHCKPCEEGTPPLKGEALADYASQVPDWQVVDDNRIMRSFKFDDFRQALEFTNMVGQLAEEEGHHPMICLTWGKVKVELYTHAINGLSENDFIMAAKINSMQM